MSKRWHITYIVIIITILAVLSNLNTAQETVVIPEVVGQFEAKDMEEIRDSIQKVVVYQDKVVEVPSKTDESLMKEYLSMVDSVGKLNMYIDQIQRREYFREFEDSNVKITTKAVALGRLEELDISYVQKEREILKQRNPIVLRAGGAISSYNQGTARITLENRKGLIYTAEVNKLGYSVGLDVPIIRIK